MKKKQKEREKEKQREGGEREGKWEKGEEWW